MSSNDKIIAEEFFNYPPSAVWKCLTEPILHAKWWAPGDVRAEVGHQFELDMGNWGKQKCEVLAVDNQKLFKYVFSVGMLNTPITWELYPENGGTRLRLTHEGFHLDHLMSKQAYEGMGRGWPNVLKNMHKALEEKAHRS